MYGYGEFHIACSFHIECSRRQHSFNLLPSTKLTCIVATLAVEPWDENYSKHQRHHNARTKFSTSSQLSCYGAKQRDTLIRNANKINPPQTKSSTALHCSEQMNELQARWKKNLIAHGHTFEITGHLLIFRLTSSPATSKTIVAMRLSTNTMSPSAAPHS